MQNVKFHELGTVDYKKAWDFQEKLFDEVTESKLKSDGKLHYLLFCEHPHVYTLGKSGQNANLLIPDEMLKKINASFYHINRGGDITYHGPGQIVAYPIFNLEAFGLTLKQYIHLLEQVIIDCLQEYDIKADRLEGATGVWLDPGVKGRERKICAIGVRASRFVTMHGLAFNVNTNLDYFRYINPCGFADKGVTSMQVELNRPVDIEEVKDKLLNHFMHRFQFTCERMPISIA
ncbi:MAG: lipoyl(octanoyl) transferase [Tenuifilum sp.]|jgi:lipoyl(octanoyl) transferase|uniref:lipoyl(octanoyl) transferase LipB n=1 Tax=Tenuifilum sp. TaxID=2760880 RepID=UPI0024AC078C|nr:lipoyl(octanoyl) transferase LipB [Tenuifilum sp.]MDI3526540.1 lipoyl(octanoyl) transferase [Tenuifilum sp.]